MNENSDANLVKIKEEFSNGYWSADDAKQFVPMLFAYVDPDDNIRTALKALSCKTEKDKRFSGVNSMKDTKVDFHSQLHEIEYILNRREDRYRKKDSESAGDSSREMAMMLMTALLNQKSSITASLDINAITDSIYKECGDCPIRDMCKQAFVVCTEYVGKTLKSLSI
jgi:hypothetical protein